MSISSPDESVSPEPAAPASQRVRIWTRISILTWLALFALEFVYGFWYQTIRNVWNLPRGDIAFYLLVAHFLLVLNLGTSEKVPPWSFSATEFGACPNSVYAKSITYVIDLRSGHPWPAETLNCSEFPLLVVVPYRLSARAWHRPWRLLAILGACLLVFATLALPLLIALGEGLRC